MKIEKLTLFSVHLNDQLNFYRDVLGFEPLALIEEKIGFEIGESELWFEKSSQSYPAHFAFNIPYQAMSEAKNWLLSNRIELLEFEGKSIIEFPDWEARALYFKDADGNIVELIGRKRLSYTFEIPFEASDTRNISEIAIATSDISEIYRILNQQSPLPIFSGNFDRFCAAGDDQGLFIMVDKNKKDWFPTGEKVEMADFKFQGDHNFEYINGKLLLN